jgi:hypothetical protein
MTMVRRRLVIGGLLTLLAVAGGLSALRPIVAPGRASTGLVASRGPQVPAAPGSRDAVSGWSAVDSPVAEPGAVIQEAGPRGAAQAPVASAPPSQATVHTLAGPENPLAAQMVSSALPSPTRAAPGVVAAPAANSARGVAAPVPVPTGLAPASAGSAGSGQPSNLAPLPNGAGLVISNGSIPCGFVIDPREYAGGVLHITNTSNVPAVLTISDPAAAAACVISGEPAEAGHPYQVDALDIVATRPVTVFVHPGRAPTPPRGNG